MQYYMPEINLVANIIVHGLIGFLFFIALTNTIQFVLGAIKWYNNKRWPQIFKNPIDPAPFEKKLIVACICWSILYIL